ncbi:hypothetical protein E4U21_006813 [Claviceps maximensis]|nr:hypothetical protein E4U21_006813 [Claviceps maximensis]
MAAPGTQTDNVSRGIANINQYRSIVLDVFTKMGYDYKKDIMPEDAELRKALSDILEVDTLSATQRRALSPYFEMGYDYANICCHHLPAETKNLIATYLSLVMFMDDDTGLEKRTILQQFNQKFLKHEPHGDRFFDQLAQLLMHDIEKHFGPFATTYIIKNLMEYVVVSVSEQQYPNGYPATSECFPDWLRSKSGNGEAFAFFIFPEVLFPEKDMLGHYLAAIADITDWLGLVNDVLSYYKERVVGSEDNCYIVNKAVMRGVTELESLHAAAKHIDVLTDRITAVLSPNEELLATWRGLQRGYLMFHVKQPRYKLKDLL